MDVRELYNALQHCSRCIKCCRRGVLSKMASILSTRQSRRCTGCRLLQPDGPTAAAFEQLCRVVDTKFQEIDASILFALRSAVSTEDGLRAFNAIFDGNTATEAAEAFSRAFQSHRKFGIIFEADRALAVHLAQHAASVHAANGGFYEGRLDCLRSTLCNANLGLDQNGCCPACALIPLQPAFR